MNNLALYKEPLYEVGEISNIKEMLEQSCSLYSEKTAFLVHMKENDEYMPITYKQLKKDVDLLGTALLDLGLKGKRVAVIGENRYEWAISYLAVVNGVGVIAPIDKELPENEIESLLKRSEAEALIFSGKNKDTIENIVNKVESVKYFINMDAKVDKEPFISLSKLISKGEQLLNNGDSKYINAEIDAEAMSIMLFTSGTTEMSKAVMLSHKNLCTNIMDMCKMIRFDSDDVFLSVLPVHHTYECTCGFLAPLHSGSAIAFCQGLRHIVKNLQQSKASIMLAVPLILEAIYKKIWEQASKDPKKLNKLKLGLALSNTMKRMGIDLAKVIFRPIHETMGGRLRLFISGAAAINPEISRGFREMGMPLVQGYGLTECSPIVTVSMDKYFKDASIGLPLPSVEVKIEDKDEGGIGEIVVHGDSVMIGYFGNEEATRKVMKDGWFHTGDIGYMDKDGFVYITGRKKNIIVTKNGKNIFPEELEVLINRALFVKESMVYGKPAKDGDTLVCATIVVNNEFLTEKYGSEVTPELIEQLVSQEIKRVNSMIPNYKHIKKYDVRENEFQKTTTKKIKRYLEMRK